ncbi:hypothetical protein ASF91_14585 [Rhizobium sp. Leaf155]|nr:hypothetical protein ASF91_14585 [Rhizobium sp. Leaf155]
MKVQGLASGQPISIALDLPAMDKMPQTSFSTTTPWHNRVTEFSGVSLKDFLSSTQLSGTKLQIIALNDYEVEADISELQEAGALLATRQNGTIMPVSDKGPVFLVFPFDSRPELQHQTYYSRAVWQIAEINVQ